MSEIPPTLPFHLARAYGATPAAQAQFSPQARELAGNSVAKIGAAEPTRAPDQVDLSRVTGRATERINRLVAATVDQLPPASDIAAQALRQTLPQASAHTSARLGADMVETTPPQRQAESLPMYRHPADRNTAATLVDLGRSLDVTG